MSATPIEISVGGSRTATEWDGCSITWADFTDDLQNAMQNNCGTETTRSTWPCPRASRLT